MKQWVVLWDGAQTHLAGYPESFSTSEEAEIHRQLIARGNDDDGPVDLEELEIAQKEEP